MDGCLSETQQMKENLLNLSSKSFSFWRRFRINFQLHLLNIVLVIMTLSV